MVQLTKRNYLGVGYLHTFKHDKTGDLVNIPCTKAEYDALAQVPPINPTLAGHTWVSSQGGTPMVDTPDSTLGLNEYCDFEGKYLVNAVDSDGLQRIERIEKADIVADTFDPTKLKDAALASFAVAFNIPI